MTKNKKILNLYEGFCRIEGKIDGLKEDGRQFVSNSSLHSSITKFAYGKALCLLSVPVNQYGRKVFFQLKKTDLEERRFYLKVTACLTDWKKYVNDLKIVCNGQTIYENEQTLFENVNLGWPTQYFIVDKGILQKGANTIELFSQDKSGGGLLLAKAELVSLPSWKEYTQISLLESVRTGDIFSVALYGGTKWQVVRTRNVTVKEISYPAEMKNVALITLFIEKTGKAECLCESNGHTVALTLPKAVAAAKDRCLVGLDFDDHRHDDCGETDRILRVFTLSALGDYLSFRPNFGRNFYEFSSETRWKERMDWLRAFQVTVALADPENRMPYFERYAGNLYLGKHIHEPYLYFCQGLQKRPEVAAAYYIDGEKLRSVESYGEAKKLYLEALDKTYAKISSDKGLSSVGSPSSLCVYEAAKFDRVTIEPVSCIPLLVGCVRGAAKRMWGAHIPVDWYFGTPHDEIHSRKFKLAMQYLYISGAQYIYAENATFKTNAFSREDWDSSFCMKNREHLRDFYDYVTRNPRSGELSVPLAVVYGNNEFFFWHPDERIAEMEENGNWDRLVWGKWKDCRAEENWRAIDAWLPFSPRQNKRDDKLNLHLFSASPYGGVDIIPYGGKYDKYRALAFLGWNTADEKLIPDLTEYVKSGGTVFISYCHLNKTDRIDKPFVYLTEGVETLTGVKISEVIQSVGEFCFESGEKIGSKNAISIAKCSLEGAKALVRDEAGNCVVTEYILGAGKVYFGLFADYSGERCVTDIMKDILSRIGEEVAPVCADGDNIVFSERIQENGDKILHLLNTSAADVTSSPYVLRVKENGGETILQGELKPCEIKKVVLHRNKSQKVKTGR